MIPEATLLVALGLASFEDLRIREVPFLLSHLTLVAGVSFAALDAARNAALAPLAESVLGALAGFALGYALYAAKQWGGGDVILLAAAGAFIGFNPWLPAGFIGYVFLTFTLGSLYGLVWVFAQALSQRDAVIAAVPRPSLIRAGLLAGVVLGGVAVALAITDSLLLAGLVADFALLAVAGVAIYMFRHADDVLTVWERSVEALVPGDWLAETVVVDGERLGDGGGGISHDDINALRRSDRDTVRVVYGVPFVPSFFVAYAAWLWLGEEFFTAVLAAFV